MELLPSTTFDNPHLDKNHGQEIMMAGVHQCFLGYAALSFEEELSKSFVEVL